MFLAALDATNGSPSPSPSPHVSPTPSPSPNVSPTPSPSPPSPASSVRLVSSSGSTVSGNTGLLQMNVGGVWRYVCDDYFDSNNNGANVACRELGYGSGTHSNGRAPVDSFYDNVACTGTESRLVDCPRSSSENCGTSEAVTLTCAGARPTPTPTPTPGGPACTAAACCCLLAAAVCAVAVEIPGVDVFVVCLTCVMELINMLSRVVAPM